MRGKSCVTCDKASPLISIWYQTRVPGTDKTAMDFRRSLPEIRWQSCLSPVPHPADPIGYAGYVGCRLSPFGNAIFVHRSHYWACGCSESPNNKMLDYVARCLCFNHCWTASGALSRSAIIARSSGVFFMPTLPDSTTKKALKVERSSFGDCG